MENLKVHIVEDQVIIAYDLQDMLEDMGHHVDHISSSVDEAIEKLESTKSDVFIVDINLKGDKNGFELGKVLQKLDKPFIYMSSLDNISPEKKDAANAFLTKPFDRKDVYKALEIICKKVA